MLALFGLMGAPKVLPSAQLFPIAAYSPGKGEAVEDAVGGHGGTIEGTGWAASKYGAVLKPDPPASGSGVRCGSPQGAGRR